MAKLERQNDTLSYYFGWYGICDGETSCADFVLNESRDVYDHIYRVFQINQFGDNYSIFDGTYDFENSNEQQFQDFSSLTCGKAYLIVLREGDGFLNLDNFTYTNDSTASFGGLLRTSCVDANPPITTEIKQSSDSLSFYMGWYGVCDECTETYDLTIEGHREKIFRVFQINERNENYSVFLPSYTPEQDFMQDFTHLECGRAYLIVLKRGNETLDDLTNFVATNKLSTSAGTLVDDCQAPVGNNLNSPRVALTSENIDVDNMIWFDSSDIPTVNATMYNVTKECGEVEPVPTPTATPSYTPIATPSYTPTPKIIHGNTLSGLHDVEGNGTYSKLSHDGKTLVVFHPGTARVPANPTLNVYEQIETGWVERASSVVEETTTTMLDSGQYRLYCHLLAITPTADKIVVGLPGIDKVKVYSFTNNNLVQIGDDITADDLDITYKEKFGNGVAISQDGSIVGVSGPAVYVPHGTGRGYHRVFEYKNDNWTKKGTRAMLSNNSHDGLYGTGIDFNSDATEMIVTHISGKMISWIWSETYSDYIRTNFDIDLAPSSADSAGNPAPGADLTPDGKTIAVSYSAKSIVRVYTRANTSSEWTQKGQNISTFVSGSFAAAVHVSISEDGSILAVGDNRRDIGPSKPGWVRIFKWADDGWVQLGDTIVRDPNNQAEGHVHLSGDGSTFAVGSRINTNVTIYNVNTFSDEPVPTPTATPSHTLTSTITPSYTPTITPSYTPTEEQSVQDDNSE